MGREYEWVMEDVDRHGDIIDPHFETSLKMLMTYEQDGQAVKTDYALVRFEGNSEDGETQREYAYLLPDGTAGVKLPDEFPDGVKVPKKYHQELYNLHRKK